MSAIDSPRPNCAAFPSIITGVPPRSAIPTSKDTRVRVEGLSKTVATARDPARVASGRRACGSAFIAAASAEGLGLLGGGQVVVAQKVAHAGGDRGGGHEPAASACAAPSSR